MTVTPEFGFPLPSDQSLIASFPRYLREQSRTLEAKLPGALSSTARAIYPGEVSRQIEPVRTELTGLATDAQRSAARAADALEDHEPRIQGLEAMAGLSPEGVTDGQTAALISNGATLTRAALDEATEPLSGRIAVFESRTPEHYGAAGDGVTDDTTALRAWAAAGGGTLPPRRYRIRGGLTYNGDSFCLAGDGAVLIVDGGDTLDTRVLSITGDRADISGLSIQAAEGVKVRGGIYVYGAAAKIQGCRIEGLTSDLESRAIHVEGSGGHLIEGNRIDRIHATGNATSGDGNGMARGIVVYGTTDATASTLVANNRISRITGEEGDGIAVLFSPGDGSEYVSAKVSIIGNVVDDCSRRHIKVQAWDVDIHSNVLRDSEAGISGNEASSISAYASGRLSIRSNMIWPGDLGSSISLHGGALGGTVEQAYIVGNTISAATGADSRAIYVDSVWRTVVNGNTMHGGKVGVAMSNVASGAVVGNSVERLAAGSGVAAVVITASCRRIIMTGNTDSSTNIWNTFRNDAVNGVTGENLQVTA